MYILGKYGNNQIQVAQEAFLPALKIALILPAHRFY